MFPRSILFSIFALVAFTASPAMAHEFIVKPAKTVAKAGEAIPFSVVSSHAFMVSEELEDAVDVKVSAVDAFGAKDLTLTADPKAFTYDGKAAFQKSGYAMLVGHRLPQVWSKTPDGMQKGGKDKYPGAPFANAYEKFAKTLLVVDKPDGAWNKPAGLKLEIMPLADPAGYKAGQEAAFQIIYDGQPLSTEVFATCDGYTKAENSYGWYTETNDKGVAQVKFMQKGLWMVRVQHKVPGKDGVKEHVMRSVLVFAVN
jgi:uncharacterized GH25 family protein